MNTSATTYAEETADKILKAALAGGNAITAADGKATIIGICMLREQLRAVLAAAYANGRHAGLKEAHDGLQEALSEDAP
jgi:hypothetical protein